MRPVAFADVIYIYLRLPKLLQVGWLPKVILPSRTIERYAHENITSNYLENIHIYASVTYG